MLKSHFILSHYIKERLQHRCFSVNIEKLLATALFIERLWWLLLLFLYFVFTVAYKCFYQFCLQSDPP